MGQGGGIALTEEDKPDDVHHRTDVRPVKVDVGDAPGRFLEVDEQSRDGIGNRGAPGVEDRDYRLRASRGYEEYSVKSDVSPRSTSTK